MPAWILRGAVIAWIGVAASGQASEPPPLRLLALTSYERGDPWTEGILRGYREVLRRIPTRLSVESLSERQRELTTYEDAFFKYLQAKYRRSQFDGILVSDDTALRFVLKYRKRLFPATPIVFCGVGMWDPQQLRGHEPYVRGVLEPLPFRETLRTALRLFPATTGVALVVGDTPNSRIKASWIRDWLHKERPDLQWVELTGLAPKELGEAVAGLPESSLLYKLSYHSTLTNPHDLNEEEIWEVVARNAQVPILCTVREHLPLGCFGGLLNSGEAQGREAAGILVRWTQGDSPEKDLPATVPGATRFAFDHEQLRKFKVSPLSLPAGSYLEHPPGSLDPQTRLWTLAGIALAGFQSLVIAALILAHLRRRRAETALAAQTSLLKNIIANIPHLVFWKDRFLVFRGCNDNLARAAGLQSPDDIIGKTDVELPWSTNQIAHFVDTDRKVLETGKPVLDLEETLRRGDGRTVILRTSKVLLRDGQGNILGILGIAVDITEQKQAAAALERIREDLEHRVRARTAELRRSYDQLRALSKRLLTVQEQERTRISREIHDEFGQTLTALKIDLSWLRQRLSGATPVALDKIGSMSKHIDLTIAAVRKMARDLRPGSLDDLGLVPALEGQLQEFEERTGIRCHLRRQAEDFDLGEEEAIALFRVFQEALTNVARHAQADSVDVSLRREGSGVLLEIRDNGKGIKETDLEDPRSLGLLGIRERVLAVGGRVDIGRGFPRGTFVRVSLPFAAQASA